MTADDATDPTELTCPLCAEPVTVYRRSVSQPEMHSLARVVREEPRDR